MAKIRKKYYVLELCGNMILVVMMKIIRNLENSLIFCVLYDIK